jgi:small subunit ribosomal protein S15
MLINLGTRPCGRPISTHIGYTSRTFHTSINARVSERYLKKIRRVQKHFAKQLMKPTPVFVDPVMGRERVPFLERIRAMVSEPFNQISGLKSENTSKLLYGAQQAALIRADGWESKAVLEQEAHKREAVNRIVSMLNAPQSQFKKSAVGLAVKEFGRFEGDTGSSEVQAAVTTIHIHYLVNHFRDARHDYRAKRRIQQLVHDRQGMLKYLKRKDPQRYFWTLEKLGLDDAAVVNEFALSRKYMEKVQFLGDNTLPVPKTKKDMKEARRMAKMKKKSKRFFKEEATKAKQKHNAANA